MRITIEPSDTPGIKTYPSGEVVIKTKSVDLERVIAACHPIETDEWDEESEEDEFEK